MPFGCASFASGSSARTSAAITPGGVASTAPFTRTYGNSLGATCTATATLRIVTGFCAASVAASEYTSAGNVTSRVTLVCANRSKMLGLVEEAADDAEFAAA